MKRRTLRYLVPVAALLAAAGCDYKESFPYQGDELIDFTTDSLYFSFGKEPFSVTEKMMEVGVEIVGSPVSHDRGWSSGSSEQDTKPAPARAAVRKSEKNLFISVILNWVEHWSDRSGRGQTGHSTSGKVTP